MKILYVTTIGSTMNFFQSVIKELITDGHTVDIATNERIKPVPDFFRNIGCRVFQLDCTRTPFDFQNFKSIIEIRNIVKSENYDIVHCHTPIASFCTRLGCQSLRKSGLKVIYTAHGFHFYQGAPAKNWLVFYPLERICSRWTDILITINKEDYALAQKKMKAKKIEYIPGVGIDTEKFRDVVVDRAKKRKEIGVPEDACFVLSVGELNENKNHQVVIRAIANLGNKNIHYVIAGNGNQKEALENLARELGIEEQFHLLGFRNDVAELFKTADIYVLPSIREGLNVSVMEALASGVPCVVGKIRGNVDMIQDDVNGYLVIPNNTFSMAEGIKKAINTRLSKNEIVNSTVAFNKDLINSSVIKIYLEVIQG